MVKLSFYSKYQDHLPGKNLGGIERNIVDERCYINTKGLINKAIPVFDQLDIKAKWSLQVTAPSDWMVISNESKIESANGIENINSVAENFGFSNLDEGFSTFEFGATNLLPINAFNILAGPYKCTEDPDVPELKIYARDTFVFDQQ